VKDPIIFILIALVVTGIIVFLSFWFTKKARVKRKLKKLPAQKIYSFTDGAIGKVSGKVELTGSPLIAPLSGRRCAYYHVLVEQLVSTGKSSHWKKLIEEEVAGPFGIRDGSSCARVEGTNVISYIVDDRKYNSGFMEDATEVLVRYLEKHGHKSENFMGFNKRLRFREGLLEEGETIAVMGTAYREHPAIDQWSDDFGKVLVFRSSKESPVYLSDDPETTA